MNTNTGNVPRDNGIKVLHKAFSILKYMAERQQAVTIADIALYSGIPKGTVYRILGSLLTEGIVLSQNGSYTLGPAALLLGQGYRAYTQLAEIARPILIHLRNKTEETVHLFILENWELFYLDKIESLYQVRMHSRVGDRGNPRHLSAGRAILAQLSHEKQLLLLGKEQADERLLKELQDIRLQGYAIDNGQNEPGLRCVGAAIPGSSKIPMGAVSISAPVYRFTEDKIPLFGQLVFEAAQKISAALPKSGSS